jgi:hypothetical protein
MFRTTEGGQQQTIVAYSLHGTTYRVQIAPNDANVGAKGAQVLFNLQRNQVPSAQDMLNFARYQERSESGG